MDEHTGAATTRHGANAPAFTPPAVQAVPKPARRPVFQVLMLVLRENLLPIVVAAVIVVLFGRLGQVQEALFGTIGLQPPLASGPDQPPVSDRNRPPVPYVGPQFWALLATIAMLAGALWYASRLLLTVDAATRQHLARMKERRHASGMVEHFPRLLGSATAAGLVVTLLVAQGSVRFNGLLLLGIGLMLTLGPVFTVAWIISRELRLARMVAELTGALGGWFVGAGMLAWAAWFGGGTLPVPAALALACVLPASFHVLVALRRRALRRLLDSRLVGWIQRLCRTEPQRQPLSALIPVAPDNVRFSLRQGLARLLVLGASGGVIVLLLALGPLAAARALGSPAIVLMAATALLCLLCGATLVLRRLDHRHPGSVVAGVTGLLALYVVLHAAFGWRPLREQVGEEILDPVVSAAPNVPAQLQAQTRRDIVVNAYGGGLRAALFTAQVLAEIDDRSCGEFGRRLEHMSGVSGGSLGLAVYLALRQDLIAAGGWSGCTPGLGNPRLLTDRVGEVLLQDHLSAALARMLSVDLITWHTPLRGQALLESWQDALMTRLVSGASAGLAMPLRALNGGMTPGPAVYFNTTRVQDGRTVWFSNRGELGDKLHREPLAEGFQLGQAVLHSARFPFVSPAGGFARGAGAMHLVDGGYADNSGAATLDVIAADMAGRRWLNIDGNAPDDVCVPSGAKRNDGVFSGLDALLAVRKSQAELAVERFGKSGQRTPVALQLDVKEAFSKIAAEGEDPCLRVRELRQAPLGWYLTPITAGDLRLARQAAVGEACDALKPLCGP